MTFHHLRLIIAAFERIFYLSAIFFILWIKGFLWAILSIASFFLLATLLFAKLFMIELDSDKNLNDLPKNTKKS